MNRYNKKTVQSREFLTPAFPFLSKLNISFIEYISKFFVVDFFSNKFIGNAIFFVIILIFGLYFNKWSPMMIFLGTYFFIYIKSIWKLRSTYKSLSDNIHYWVDQYGISINFESDGKIVRYETYSWSQVKLVIQFQNLIVLDSDDKGDFGRVILQPKDMSEVKSLLSFWSMYLNDLPIEEMPIYYQEEEYIEIENFIENSFGEIYRVGDVEGLKKYGVDLAVIKPTAEKPYYTLSTIGLGAHRIENDVETRHEFHAPDYCEFMMYLPADWNLTDEGCEKPENFWPIRIIQMAVEMLINEKANIRDGIYNEDDTLSEKCGVQIVYIENPMPDITTHTFVNTTSGRTVQFYQLVPLSEQDAEIMEQTDTFYELISRITGVEFNEDSTEETNKAVSQALLSNTLTTFITAQQHYLQQKQED